TAFTLFVMGLSAILVGFFAIFFPKFLHLQMIIWLVLSIGTIYLSHRFMPKGQNRSISDATEGKTITEILPGEFGRVMFEGNSWRARCSDNTMTIPANIKVYVVAREGTTLTVIPQNLLTEN
ncbi:MAG TPA: NfeD family protein, partial [Allocoleopsis sp.]